MREAPFECPQDRLRQAQGERETETPTRLAPALGSRFRGKDDGGVRDGMC